MQFKENKAIYLQIADLICEDIAAGKFKEDDKIPSVREYATTLEVNANTCARAFDWLQGMDIIYTKRGLGYFVTEGAKETVLSTNGIMRPDRRCIPTSCTLIFPLTREC